MLMFFFFFQCFCVGHAGRRFVFGVQGVQGYDYLFVFFVFFLYIDFPQLDENTETGLLYLRLDWLETKSALNKHFTSKGKSTCDAPPL